MKIFYLCYPWVSLYYISTFNYIMNDILLQYVYIHILQLKIKDKDKLLMIFICSRSLSVYFVMFGIRTASFFDISFSSGKEERKTKYVLGKYHH